MFRSFLCVQLTQLQVDSLDLCLGSARLKLQVQVKHSSGLGRQIGSFSIGDLL